MKVVQIGAGNIGRSFVGQLFSRAGYEVVFIDVDEAVVNALNARREYSVEIRDREPQTLVIRNVRGVNGRAVAACAEELATADIAATAVGPGALPHIYPTLARGLERRAELGRGPLDVIIAENLRDAADHFRQGLRAHLPPGFPLEEHVGLVETSIGKMVPIMPDEVRRQDPLLVYAEAYNTLILDARAFKNPIPTVTGLDPRQNMKAYVDRKLFVHNCGHALAAYLAHLEAPEAIYTYEAVEHHTVGPAVRAGMWESGRALIAEYPDEFSEANIGAHIDDLLRRFANRALGDTIYRVGRDVRRKLSRDDRLVGALRLDARRGVPAPMTTLTTAAAMFFRATDEHGQPYGPDRELADAVAARGPEFVLHEVCGLGPEDEPVARRIVTAYEFITERLESEPARITDFAWKGGGPGQRHPPSIPPCPRTARA